MVSKLMKRCSTSYAIRELQIKTMRYLYIHIRMAKIQNTNTTKCWQGATELSFTTGRNAKWYSYFGRQLGSFLFLFFLTKLNILLPHNLAIMLLGIYLNELKTYVHTNTYSEVFIVALLLPKPGSDQDTLQ